MTSEKIQDIVAAKSALIQAEAQGFECTADAYRALVSQAAVISCCDVGLPCSVCQKVFPEKCQAHEKKNRRA